MGNHQSVNKIEQLTMEILNKLNKLTSKPSRRVGRGYGSKKGGHTTGRGQKGDKSRGKTNITFEGTKIKKGWIKRLPFLRGKNRTSKLSQTVIFSLDKINKYFKEGAVVDMASLQKLANLSKSHYSTRIKILSTGNITKKLTFKNLQISQKASDKIIAAGGKIEV